MIPEIGAFPKAVPKEYRCGTVLPSCNAAWQKIPPAELCPNGHRVLSKVGPLKDDGDDT